MVDKGAVPVQQWLRRSQGVRDDASASGSAGREQHSLCPLSSCSVDSAATVTGVRPPLKRFGLRPSVSLTTGQSQLDRQPSGMHN